MSKNLKIITQKRAKEAKSCMKLPRRKMKILEHDGQNLFKTLTNTVKQNCPEFVMLSKRETFENLDRKMLGKVRNFGTQGFDCFFFVLLFRLL